MMRTVGEREGRVKIRNTEKIQAQKIRMMLGKFKLSLIGN